MGRIDAFVDQLAARTSSARAAARWRTLVLLYPNTDTEYQTADGRRLHFKGSLDAQQVAQAHKTFSALPGLARQSTGGYCDMEVRVEIIHRPVTFGGRVGFQCPQWTTDCLPEKQRLNDPAPYDAVIIAHNPGPIPQDLAGSGGLNGSQCVQNYRIDSLNAEPSRLDRSLAGIVHEWIHGLDTLFRDRGYRGIDLHHLVRLKAVERRFPGYGYNPNWHAAILQGRMLSLTESPYGFSRAAWVSGSAAAPVEGPRPVQLLTPLPGTALPTGTRLSFEWNPSPGAAGYRFRLYREGRYDSPLLSREARDNWLELPSETVTPGRFVWTVHAIDESGRLSPVGEAFPFEARQSSAISPIQLTPRSQRPDPVDCVAGRSYPALVSASSPCGLQAVYREVDYPDGRRQRIPLRKRSHNENEPGWAGNLVFWGPQAGAAVVECETRWVAVDQGGRRLAVPAERIRIAPSPEIQPVKPFGHRLLSPQYLQPLNDAAHMPPVPPSGGVYPLYVLLDGIHPAGGGNGVTGAWMEVSGPEGALDRAGLERWDSFNGMMYGQCLFPPNERKEAVKWSVVFAVVKGGEQYRSAPISLTQIHRR